jgi:hypothetical protein
VRRREDGAGECHGRVRCGAQQCRWMQGNSSSSCELGALNPCCGDGSLEFGAVDALEGLDYGSGSAAATGGQQQEQQQEHAEEEKSGQVQQWAASLRKRADVCIWTGLGWVTRGQGGMNARAAMC